tara:strand:- start:2477 stop:3238 length:762 start_codon:yes stop_codon:yes gene_type:complete
MTHIRSHQEVEKIRESSRIVYETLQVLKDSVVEGMTGNQLDTLAEEFILSQGGRPAFKGYMGYTATLCISINDTVVHGIPDETEFRNCDIVSIDCGVLKDGYYGDSAHTYVVGKVSDNVQKLLDVTEQSLNIGIDKARTGNYVSDIGHAIQTYVEENGFSVVRNLVGHGIGTALHEDPQVPNYGDPGQGIKLKSGMCLAIEPMVNEGHHETYTKPDGWSICTKDGSLSAHFEHTIVVTDDGGTILSNGVYNGY